MGGPARRRYIVRQGQGYDLSLAGPFRNRSANMQLHVLNARLLPLHATLTHYLNGVARPGVSYLPLADRVVVSCVDIAEGRAGDESLGSSHEVEVAFFIVAVRFDPWPSGIVCFNPYLFVNHSWAMVPGREIHGFRKDLAISFSDSLDVNGPGWRNRARDIAHVETWAMRRRARESRLERMKLVEFRHHDDQSPLPEDAARLAEALLGTGPGALGAHLPAVLRDKLPKSGQLSQMLKDLVHGREVRVTSVFLRQFRDPRHSETADVQEVVEATSLATLKASPRILRPSEVYLHHADSHPIADELGLDGGTWIRASLSMELDMDFVLDDAVR